MEKRFNEIMESQSYRCRQLLVVIAIVVHFFMSRNADSVGVSIRSSFHKIGALIITLALKAALLQPFCSLSLYVHDTEIINQGKLKQKVYPDSSLIPIVVLRNWAPSFSSFSMQFDFADLAEDGSLISYGANSSIEHNV